MQNILTIDIGAGTMDVLCYVPDEKMHYKAVVVSPVRTMAAAINAASGDLLVSGREMGGGPVTTALKERCQTHEVVISTSASATLHHDPARVKALGLRIIPDEEIAIQSRDSRFHSIVLNDIDVPRIQQIVEGFGLPFEFKAVAVCAQDHGVAPTGVSHLDFRHQAFKAKLDKAPRAHALLYPAEAIPTHFNRLRAIAGACHQLPAQSVYVMDSGMAAILGASMDPAVQGKETYMVLDIATSHTVGAVLRRQTLLGSFEYHTHDISLNRLEQLLLDLPDGKLTHTQILSEGGHGAYLREAPGYSQIEAIVATGPKRRLMKNTKLPITWGAPWGDNMMTGCVGLLEAVRQHQQMAPIVYI